jgi:hypothetical protein
MVLNMGMVAELLHKYQKMRDVDEEDREAILSLKEKGFIKIGINIKREKLVARAITPQNFSKIDK